MCCLVCACRRSRKRGREVSPRARGKALRRASGPCHCCLVFLILAVFSGALNFFLPAPVPAGPVVCVFVVECCAYLEEAARRSGRRRARRAKTSALRSFRRSTIAPFRKVSRMERGRRWETKTNHSKQLVVSSFITFVHHFVTWLQGEWDPV